jgi:Domain of unknown function (DUF4173)
MTDPAPEFWSPTQTANDLESGTDRFAPPSTVQPPPTARPARDALPLLLTLGLTLLAYLLTRNTGAVLGLNSLLIVAALLGSLYTALKLRGQPTGKPALLLLALGGACAVGLTLNAGDLITALNVLGLLISLALGLAYLHFPNLHSPNLMKLSVGQMLLTAIWSGLRGLYSFPVLARRFPWDGRFPWQNIQTKRLTGRFQTLQSRRVLVGLLLTAPLLLVFGALLGQSDARFGSLISRLFQWRLPTWNSGELAFAVIQLVFWAFVLAGPVYAALLAKRPAPQVQIISEPRLTLTELGIPLLSTGALFCAYLIIQAGSMFSRVLVGGLTYSDYARRGFGELTAVAALTLVVLLIAHTLLRRELRTTPAYRLISACVLLPLALLIASAYHRLELYVQAYGLSEIRILGGVFLAWVVLSLLTYAALLWRGGLERFAYFSLISGLGLIIGLNGVNPGRLIASVNLSRTLEPSPNGSGRGNGSGILTLTEIANLGPDALPVLLSHLKIQGGLGKLQQANPKNFSLVCALAQHNGNPDNDSSDWRVWNLARSRATRLMQQLEAAYPTTLWEECRANAND